jgi:hypothetical protein
MPPSHRPLASRLITICQRAIFFDRLPLQKNSKCAIIDIEVKIFFEKPKEKLQFIAVLLMFGRNGPG